MLKPFYMHLIPWDENKWIAKAYSKKRPLWVVPVVLAGLILVAFAWYKYFTTDVHYSIVITIHFSLTAIKGVILLFDYQKFQTWVAGMLQREKGRKIILIDIGVGVFGLLIVLFSLYVY